MADRIPILGQGGPEEATRQYNFESLRSSLSVTSMAIEQTWLQMTQVPFGSDEWIALAQALARYVISTESLAGLARAAAQPLDKKM